MGVRETTFIGRYHVVGELDRGGMANVYLCLSGGADFTKLQVLKCLKDEMRDDEQLVTMFLDEGRIATRLNHPNVVQTYDVGRIEEADPSSGGRDRYFIAMEYLEGQSLAKMLRAHERAHGRPLPRDVHLRILCDAMRGLEYAHSLTDFSGTPLNIVHRDVSPQNIFVTYSGVVKVIDFGIAKAAMRASESTEAGIMKGKASYVAPEQAMGLVIDHRVDVFAMGMMIWAAAVGRPMWRSDTPDVQRLAAILAGALEMPRDVDPNVPRELDKIVRKALEKDPSDRYASMTDLRLAVEHYLASHPSLSSSTNDERQTILTELFAARRAAIEEAIRSHIALRAQLEQDDSQSFIHLAGVGGGGKRTTSVSPTVMPARTSTPPSSLHPERTTTDEDKDKDKDNDGGKSSQKKNSWKMIALNVVMVLVLSAIITLAMRIYSRSATKEPARQNPPIGVAINLPPPPPSTTSPPAPVSSSETAQTPPASASASTSALPASTPKPAIGVRPRRSAEQPRPSAAATAPKDDEANEREIRFTR